MHTSAIERAHGIAGHPDGASAERLRRWPSLTLMAIAEVLALSLWFSATAIVPELEREGGLGHFAASAFTSAVQLGFVVGTLASALLGLADRLDPRRFFMVSALLAAFANGLVAIVGNEALAVLPLRFLTGVAMAGIYPVGLRLAASWARGDLGLLTGLLVGALTLGSASPHLLTAAGGFDWRFTILASSLAALLAALLIPCVALGPRLPRAGGFRPAEALAGWRQPALRLVNLGYLGHMWELYALWAWAPVFLCVSFETSMSKAAAAELAAIGAFATVAAGAPACVLAGRLADRWGRSRVAGGALCLSGSAALSAAVIFGGSPTAMLAVAILWGAAAVADSAQFSAATAELSPPERVGTMLTAQTCGGFLLTLASLHLLPLVAESWGWSSAIALLSVGPFLGVLAMARLELYRPADLRARP